MKLIRLVSYFLTHLRELSFTVVTQQFTTSFELISQEVLIEAPGTVVKGQKVTNGKLVGQLFGSSGEAVGGVYWGAGNPAFSDISSTAPHGGAFIGKR